MDWDNIISVTLAVIIICIGTHLIYPEEFAVVSTMGWGYIGGVFSTEFMRPINKDLGGD